MMQRSSMGQLTGRLTFASSLGPGVLVPLETALAAVLGLLFLGEKSFWLSEAFSVAFAKLSWPDFWQIVSEREANQGLYYLLLRPWIVLGEGEAVVRSLSVIFAAATIPVIYALGARLFGQRVGLVAGLLMAVNGFFVQYSHEARAYSLVLLLVTSSSYLFVTCPEQPSRRRWAAYALVSGLAVYAHFFAGLVLVSHAASLAFIRRERIPWRGYAEAAALIAVLVAPLGLFVLFQESGQLDWVGKPSISEPARVLVRLAGGGVPAVGYFVACGVACLAALKAWSRDLASLEAWRYGFVLTWLLAPLGIAFAVSQVEPIFVTRFLIVCLPPLVLLAAVGVAQAGSRVVFGGGLAALTLLSLYGAADWYANFEKDNWRGATRHVLSSSEAGDAVVFYDRVMGVNFDYYRGRLDDANDNLTYIDYASGETLPRGNLEGTSTDAVDPGLTDALTGRFARVWLVLSHKSATGMDELAANDRLLQSMLEEDYNLTAEQRYTGVRVLLFESR
jgi:mannosyltransferase